MALTDSAVRNAKAEGKAKKLADEKGLFLLVNPTGGKWWRLKYRFGGKEKLLSLGVYPDVTLKDARERRDTARKLLADGIDPGQHRKATKNMKAEQSANSFEAIAREWFAKFSPNWVPSHADKIIRRLERDIFPWLGSRPIAEITAPELLTCLRRIESRGALETAHRALQNCGQVYRYAVATGRAESDPSRDLKGAMPPPEVKHHAAVTDPDKVGELMRAINGYEGSFVTLCALKLAPLVFVRPGELRKAEWSEIDMDAAQWTIPAERMKMKQSHIVPLSTKAVSILRELHALTGQSRYVFPGVRSHSRPMSENTINAALRRLGYSSNEMTGHGFRAIARTILDEVLGFRPDIIEHQLAHAVKDPNGRAYNRTAHLAERRKMMQRWEEYLDELAVGAKVIRFLRKA